MTDRQLAAALAGSAASAAATRTAPSMRAALAADGALRWRWVLHPESIDLYADRSPRPDARPDARPDTQQVLLSSGGALHHARVALAADGRAATVTLLPDGDPDHLATVTAGEQLEITDEARARYEALGGQVVAPPRTPTDADLAALADAAAAEGVRLVVLDRAQVASLAAATGLGATARGRVASVARTDAFGVLCGDSDAAEWWLRAGAALSAIWLLATRRGLSVVPSSAAVALPGTRTVLRRLLGDAGTPYLALRIGGPARSGGVSG